MIVCCTSENPCAQHTSCSACSQASFGCEQLSVDIRTSWPWGVASAIDPAHGKYSYEPECYFSCGWCPTTRNPANNNAPGLCVQVTHQSHGGSCDGTAGAHCASCSPNTGVCECPRHGRRIAGALDFTTPEEPLRRPPPTLQRGGAAKRPDSKGRPLYWAPEGNPRCPDFYEHVSHGRFIAPNSSGYGEELCGRVAPGVRAPGGELYTVESARRQCPRTVFASGASAGGWRPATPGGSLPLYEDVKCGWCDKPAPGFLNCQVANFRGIEFEAVHGALAACPHCESLSAASDVVPAFAPIAR